METKPTQAGSVGDEPVMADVVRRLVAAFSPRAIYLFGSHARGTPTRDSDVDIYVLIAAEGDAWELSDCGYRALRDVHLPIELHFCTVEAFERFSGVVGSVQKEVKERGRLLYAA